MWITSGFVLIYPFFFSLLILFLHYDFIGIFPYKIYGGFYNSSCLMVKVKTNDIETSLFFIDILQIDLGPI